MMAAARYQYPDLPTRTSIRILRILSAEPSKIRVSLRPVDLPDQPLYDCLSYTWGDPLYYDLWGPSSPPPIRPDQRVQIECNGKPLTISESLRQALIQLAENGYSSGDTSHHGYTSQGEIWIDAICINQENVKEKGVQVPMMRDIYTAAQNVIVWLGTPGVRVEHALEVIERLAKVALDRRHELPPDLYHADVGRILRIGHIERQQWLDYAAFLQRSWFSRIWVVQETFFARRVIVFCGSHVVSWKELTAGTRVLQHTQLGQLLMTAVWEILRPSTTTLTGAENVILNQFVFENMREKRTLLQMERLLTNSRYFKATNPKDHVYAVLGMCAPSEAHVPATELVQPEYGNEVSLEEVFTEASWICLSETTDLKILSLVEDQSVRKRPGLPSWVPDWSRMPQAYPLVDNVRPAPGQERWNASGGLAWDAAIIRRHGQPLSTMRELRLQTSLPVQGLCVDVIAERAATYEEFQDQHDFKSLLELLQHALDFHRHGPPSGHPAAATAAATAAAAPVEGFWRALIKDTFDGAPAAAAARAAFPLLVVVAAWELDEALRLARDPYPDPAAADDPALRRLERVRAATEALLAALAPRTDPAAAAAAAAGPSIDAAPDPGASAARTFLPGGVVPAWSAIRAVMEGAVEGAEADAATDQIRHAFQTAYTGRRLFRTTRASHLGVAARSLQPGDSLWVLAGADVPMVLRPPADSDAAHGDGGRPKWRLVGEAYVWGLMNGEAVRGGATEGSRTIALADIDLI